MIENLGNKVIPYRMNLNWLAKRWMLELDVFSEALVQLVNIDGLKVYTDYRGYAIYGFYGYSSYESPKKQGAKWYEEPDLNGWYSQNGADTLKKVLKHSLNNRSEPNYAEKLMQLDRIRYEAYLDDRERIPELVDVHGQIELLDFDKGKISVGSLYVDESMGDSVYVRLKPLVSKGDGAETVFKRMNFTLDLDKAFIYRDDLKHFEQSHGWFDHGIDIKSEIKEKAIDTRERNSYLSFIKSLCEYHGVELKRIKAKQLEVHKDEGKDFSISERTVLKILNELKKHG